MTIEHSHMSVEAALVRGDAYGVTAKLSLACGGAVDIPPVAADKRTSGEEDR